MDRRGFLYGAAALAGAAGAAQAQGQPDDLRSAAREAWLYGLPLVELARARAAAIGRDPTRATHGFNTFAHARTPADARSRDFSAPEADVLYSSAWVFLDGGSATITAPPCGGRYALLTIADMYGDILDVIEGRETGKDGRQITVMGPPRRLGVGGYSAPLPRLPALRKVIHAPGQWIWVLVRIHLEAARPADLAAAQALQDGFRIEVGASAPSPAPPVSIDAAWGDYFFAVQRLIEESPPPQDEVNFFRRIAPMQVGMRGGFESARFADADTAAIEAGVTDARTLALELDRTSAARGWIGPAPDLAAFGQDFLYRARVALTQTGAPPPASVVSLRAAPPSGGSSFPSDGRYRVVLPTRPPAAAFWSLTLYRVTDDGRLFLADNPAGRYAVGTWTTGLARRPDGAVEVLIERERLGTDHAANWLPAPDAGDFTLILRVYAPDPSLLAAAWRPAPAELIAPG